MAKNIQRKKVEHSDISRRLSRSARALTRLCATLQFAAPAAFVYNPLDYAWAVHADYIKKYGRSRKRTLFLGMNPGPFGMAQTGIPFGEVELVRDWLQVTGRIGQPDSQHPKRPITGFECTRSEVSGRRLWGLFKDRFGTAGAFFKDHYVTNFCPLVFMEASGRNLTPDKLPRAEREPLLAACRKHLAEVISILGVRTVVGVGKFAEKEVATTLQAAGLPDVQVAALLHPSPASPAANQDWPGKAAVQLRAQGVWS